MKTEKREMILRAVDLYNKFLDIFGKNNEFAAAAFYNGFRQICNEWEEWDLLWNELSEPVLRVMLIPRMAATARSRTQLVVTMARCPKNPGASRIVRREIQMNYFNQIPELMEEVEKFFSTNHSDELPLKVGKLPLKQWILKTFLYGQKVEEPNN
jgi:hypothetical protein